MKAPHVDADLLLQETNAFKPIPDRRGTLRGETHTFLTRVHFANRQKTS